MLGRILLWLLVVVVLVVAGIAVTIAFRPNLKVNAPDPAVAASADSAVIARGRYVVRNVGPCVECHIDPTTLAAAQAGEDVPLAGGTMYDIPPGKFYVPNITPDPETGVGRFS